MVRELRSAGCKIAIYTCRDDREALEEWLEENNVPYDWINENPYAPDGVADEKMYADVYLDDRAANARQDAARALAEIKEMLQAEDPPPVFDMSRLNIKKSTTLATLMGDKQASLDSHLSTLRGLATLPPIQNWLNSKGLVMSDPALYFAINQLQKQRAGVQFNGMAQCAEADKPSYEQLGHGIANLFGSKPTRSPQGHSESRRRRSTAISPYMAGFCSQALGQAARLSWFGNLAGPVHLRRQPGRH